MLKDKYLTHITVALYFLTAFMAITGHIIFVPRLITNYEFDKLFHRFSVNLIKLTNFHKTYSITYILNNTNRTRNRKLLAQRYTPL